MKIEFCPNDKGTGVASYCGWDDGRMAEAMRQVFRASDRERIVRLVIDRYGVTAFFENKAS